MRLVRRINTKGPAFVVISGERPLPRETNARAKHPLPLTLSFLPTTPFCYLNWTPTPPSPPRQSTRTA